MSVIVVGGEASVTVVSGDTFYSTLMSLLTIQQATLTVSGEAQDVTALHTTNAKTLSGLRSWSVQIAGFLYAIPRLGNSAVVAASSPSQYVTNARAWAITIEPMAVHDITSLGASAGSAPTWREFRPDNIVGASGIYTCGVDSATQIRYGSSTEPIQGPSFTDDTSPDALPDFVFTYGDSATDESVAFEGMVTSYPIPIIRGGKTESVFSVVSSGPLTAAGTSSIFGSGSIVSAPFLRNASASAALKLRFAPLHGTRYFETDTANGGDAFWRRITIGPVEVGSPVAFAIDFQGSGPLVTV